MVVAHDAGLLALNAVVGASAEKPKRCRTILTAAVRRMERHNIGGPKAAEGAQCLRTACFACARCPGI